MVARAQHRAGDAGAQMRLAPPRLGARKPFEVEAKALLELIGKAQLLGVVAGQGHDHRAFVPVADRDPGSGLDLAREIRPEKLTFQGQRQQCFFAGLGLDRGGEHTGRGPARAMTGLAAIIDRDRTSRLGQPPGNPQSDDPGADDDGLRPMRG